LPYNGSAAPSKNPAPYIYLPVNKRQAAQYATSLWKQWNKQAGAAFVKFMYARTDPGNDPLDAMSFPPAQYDAYALVSVGPWGQTGGITDNSGPGGSIDTYHRDVMRAYFLATRDANENGLLDFDFRARSKLGEGKRDAFVIDGLYHLPNEFQEWADSGFTGSNYGPMIGTP
jgi:hypothetical protein